jgi:uncharacterized membrane-anchored protein
MTNIDPPTDLKDAGKRLWASVHADYELSSAETALLREACRATDELEILRQALLDSEVVSTGSMGQPVVNRLFDEIRKHRDSLAKTITAMNLPGDDDEEETAASIRSEKASKAAKAKWQKYKEKMNSNG